MSSNTKLMASLMLLTLIASGCTGGSSSEEETNTQAVSVQEFSAFPSPSPSDQTTRLRMRVENVGDAEVQNLSARLYNPPFATESGQANTWRSTGDSEKVSDSERTLTYGNLRSGSEQTPAVPQTQSVQFISPDLNQGRDVTYTYRSTLSYVYQTSAETEVEVIDSDRYRQQGSPAGSASVTNSKGPVKLDVRTPTPFVVYDSGNNVEKKICLVARNKGSGTPFDYTTVDYSDDTGFNISDLQQTDNLNTVIIQAENVGGVDLTAQNSDFGNDNQLKTDILGGKGIGCFQVDLGTVSGSIQRTLPLEFTAYYGYKQSSSLSIPVEGRGQQDSDIPGAPGSGGGDGDGEQNGDQPDPTDEDYSFADGSDQNQRVSDIRVEVIAGSSDYSTGEVEEAADNAELYCYAYYQAVGNEDSIDSGAYNRHCRPEYENVEEGG